MNKGIFWKRGQGEVYEGIFWKLDPGETVRQQVGVTMCGKTSVAQSNLQYSKYVDLAYQSSNVVVCRPAEQLVIVLFFIVFIAQLSS